MIVLHADHPKIKALLLRGNFGLEKESLRVDGEGFLSHTNHPFPNDDHIVRDFCENQTEINTSVAKTAAEAVGALREYDRQIQKTLKCLPEREYLWPFSNPPYIPTADIEALSPEVKREPLAALDGGEDGLTFYRAILRDYAPLVKPGGHILLEMAYDQAEDLRSLAAEYLPMASVEILRDLGGNDRVTHITLPKDCAYTGESPLA